LPRQIQNRNFTSILGDRTKGLLRQTQNRNFTAIFGDRTSFRIKALPRHTQNSNFSSGFGNRTSFRAKVLHFTPSRWHYPAPSRKIKRKLGKKKRSKRAKEQEGKGAWEDVKM